MALTFPSSPSAFPPLSSSTLHPISHFSFTVYLSRLQTLNAEPFNCRRRHRFSSVLSILPPSVSSSSSTPSLDSKPHGSPSSRSTQFKTPRRFSKHSKFRHGRIADSSVEHPAFKPFRPPRYIPLPVSEPDGEDPIHMTEKGLTYKLKDAPFEFQYSYTETPKVKPVALRETPFLPLGPKETPRPWTGKAPLPASKKKLPEFDSFKLPPHGKKGVKPVQSPGPFLAGSGGPRYSATREEILGEPLTKEEVQELVKGCLKTRRQLHMGRDGFTHNMLENIHAHWKRRRVCKIKCLGVCTVDMDNVCQQIENLGDITDGKNSTKYKWRMVIAYDGTKYKGWQYQPPPTPTIQWHIEDTLVRITKLNRADLCLVGSGRTDAGVHAFGQVAHFTTPFNYDNLDSLHAATNGLLPKEIRIREISPAHPEFHARFSTTSKVYMYKIYNEPVMDPFHRLYTFHSVHRLNLEAMREAASYFLGKHDFSSFGTTPSRNDGSPNPVKEIFRCDINKSGAILELEVEGTGFLYRQVRNMVALLMQVGREVLPPNIVPMILEARDRKELSKFSLPAPPHGLCLMSVKYDPEKLKPPPGAPHASFGMTRAINKCKLPYY